VQVSQSNVFKAAAGTVVRQSYS